MEASFYIICLLLLVSCTKPGPNYPGLAAAYCSENGYSYDYNDSSVYQSCIAYNTLVISSSHSNKTYPTYPEFLCEMDGVKKDDDNYDACLKEKQKFADEIAKKAAKHVADMKDYGEHAGEIIAKEQKEKSKLAEKQQKEAKIALLNADKATCKDFGLKYGTGDFADCMMKLDQYRKKQAVDQEAKQQTNQIAQQQANQAATQVAEQTQVERDQEQRRAFITALANFYLCRHSGSSTANCLAQ